VEVLVESLLEAGFEDAFQPIVKSELLRRWRIHFSPTVDFIRQIEDLGGKENFTDEEWDQRNKLVSEMLRRQAGTLFSLQLAIAIERIGDLPPNMQTMVDYARGKLRKKYSKQYADFQRNYTPRAIWRYKNRYGYMDDEEAAKVSEILKKHDYKVEMQKFIPKRRIERLRHFHTLGILTLEQYNKAKKLINFYRVVPIVYSKCSSHGPAPDWVRKGKY
jgi:hypothetical protein